MDSEQNAVSGTLIGIVAIIAIVAITFFAVRLLQTKDDTDTDQDVSPIINIETDTDNPPSSAY